MRWADRDKQQKVQVQRSKDILEVRTAVRTDGVTDRTVKLVKELARKYAGVV